MEGIATPEKDLKHGDWVYTPDEVFGSGGKEHNMFQYDERIVYSLHWGHEPVFYKINIPKDNWLKRLIFKFKH